MSKAVVCGLLACMLTPLCMAAPPSDRVLARGQGVYERCLACHAIEQHRTGPAHCGLFGRKAGTAPGYAEYSEAMKRSSRVWTARTVDAFLKAPMQALPGTSMGYDGVKDDDERAALIAWLQKATEPGTACRMAQR